MAGNDRLTELMMAGNEISRASTPGGAWRDSDGNDMSKLARTRPRTFAYFRYLPYPTEDQAEREQNLDECIKNLYIAVSAGDFSPGAVHWTREIRGWLSLKFDLPRETRVTLVKLYYELALARNDCPKVQRPSCSVFRLSKYIVYWLEHRLSRISDIEDGMC